MAHQTPHDHFLTLLSRWEQQRKWGSRVPSCRYPQALGPFLHHQAAAEVHIIWWCVSAAPLWQWQDPALCTKHPSWTGSANMCSTSANTHVCCGGCQLCDQWLCVCVCVQHSSIYTQWMAWSLWQWSQTIYYYVSKHITLLIVLAELGSQCGRCVCMCWWLCLPQ